ncbi:glycosyltransferase [Caballeronia telluris]|uniref:D-inositol 3-phosphate glycosyltransferase n=1 Tax=Caballeronia telluris TaxID=326475 RepID=A0A158GJM9_9BURK|nr:glycosyltransferase [Caballeronia telluris]SAL32315.1 D-inositol 3-phosphate glycosyltransferase [Caballeronia telluris]
MKICLSANRFPPNVVGGAEVMVHALALQLSARGHEVSVLTLSDTRAGSRAVVDGIDVHLLPNVNVYNQFAHTERGFLKKTLFGVIDLFNPLVLVMAVRKLKQLDADVLCTNTLKGLGPAMWIAAWLRRIPVVHINHDYWLVCPRSTMFKNGHSCSTPCGQCRSFARPKAWLSRLVSHSVSVSRFVEERHRELGFFARSERSVVHNAPARISFMQRLPGAPGTPFRIGFIGRIDETKGIAPLLESVKRANVQDAELHIAGRDKGGVLPDLLRQYPGLTVKHHGFMDREAFYGIVDLVVVTSMWDEPFGIVAIEPWEFGKPSIAFASGGLPEVYEGMPELVVPKGDTGALGALIQRMATDRAFYADMASRCHAQRERFVPPKQAVELERVLMSAVTARSRTARSRRAIDRKVEADVSDK